MASSSLNRETHPYMRGFSHWSKNTFWRDPDRRFSEKAKAYYEKWLSDMRVNEKRLIRLQ